LERLRPLVRPADSFIELTLRLSCNPLTDPLTDEL